MSFAGVASRPNDAIKLSEKRIALFDQYGGSMPSGWTRYEFEQFEIPYQTVYPQDLDAGNLKSKFDVLILPSGAQIRGAGGAAFAGRGGGGGGGGGGRGGNIPAEYQKMTGQMTPETTLPALKQFLNDGGVIVAVGTATSLGYALNLPIENHLVVRGPGQPDRTLTGEEYYVPGSILNVAVDNTDPVAAGFDKHLDVFFDNSPVFRLVARRGAQGHEGGRVVRQRVAAAQRLGVGTELSRGRRGHRRIERTGRARSICSGPRSRSAASPTGRSSSCSTGSTRRRT